ncbi:mannose-6-phosphate isomerase [Bacteroides eggerthii]|uniref:Mannose-6-phosphate isomerase n=1 Tax=Bacteroides eggerthii TaxID=28111 RepID=A0ABT7U6V6_9BACE|nr:mannose-6-phosphate isomerase [Bacteroides eggerthii]
MYLFTFSPIMKPTIWGGNEILRYKQMPADGRRIGESWELSAIPGSESVVDQGPYAGYTLPALTEALKSDLLGKENYIRYGGRFPLLIKFIDACDDLSVQVHPGDALAEARHHCSGKSEMWYVVKAAPEARLYSGFSYSLTPEEYERRVEECTLPEALQCYHVHEGDVFYQPAGRVHSIGAGCFICEIQQSSDITYRIYDFGRKDQNGNMRQLHLAEASEAIDYSAQTDAFTPKVRINEPIELLNTVYFSTSLYDLDEPMVCDYSELDSFVILICLNGSCKICADREEVTLNEGHTILVAAACPGLVIEPLGGEVKLIECFV